MNDYIKDANQDEQKFIIKRSGKQVPFELVKIKAAITKANKKAPTRVNTAKRTFSRFLKKTSMNGARRTCPIEVRFPE